MGVTNRLTFTSFVLLVVDSARSRSLEKQEYHWLRLTASPEHFCKNTEPNLYFKTCENQSAVVANARKFWQSLASSALKTVNRKYSARLLLVHFFSCLNSELVPGLPNTTFVSNRNHCPLVGALAPLELCDPFKLHFHVIITPSYLWFYDFQHKINYPICTAILGNTKKSSQFNEINRGFASWW